MHRLINLITATLFAAFLWYAIVSFKNIYHRDTLLNEPISKIESFSDPDKITYLRYILSDPKSFQIKIEPVATTGVPFDLPVNLREHITKLTAPNPLGNNQSPVLKPNFENPQISHISSIGCAISGSGQVLDQNIDPKSAVLNRTQPQSISWTAYIKF